MYWLELLKETDFLSEEQTNSLLSDAEELCRIIGKIQTTMKTKIRNS